MIKATFTEFPFNDNWCKGIVEDENKSFSFESKLFDVGSRFGINNGRVSKLYITENKTSLGKCVVNYDRGWDIEPNKENRKYFIEVMNLLENSPKRF